MKKLPVFVFPISLDFYLASRHTHKQLLTLYNPYDFAVNFQGIENFSSSSSISDEDIIVDMETVARKFVLCTAPHKFTVTDPEGVIAPQSCVDVAVRYNQPSSAHCSAQDKFRITMQDRTTKELLGKRDVVAKFLLGEPESIVTEERGESFQPMPVRPVASATMRTDQIVCNHPSHSVGSPSALVMFVCALCVLALLMPTAPPQPAPPSSLTAMLPLQWQARVQLSLNLQLVCAYILGLVTMILLRL